MTDMILNKSEADLKDLKDNNDINNSDDNSRFCP